MRGTSRSRLSDELAWEDMNTRRSMHKLVLYYKIVNNLTPSFLSDLLPPTVQQGSGLFLRNFANFTLYMSRTERFKKSFFPLTTLMWNNLELRDRDLSSVKVFKRSLGQYYDILTYNKLYDFANDWFSSILHTRLHLGCCGLNYYLFKINCILSPMCICSLTQSMKHVSFLKC